ncbi:hypothetical protein CAEBREN_01566 [Caenorhabditis brenneri]|uniref:F-box domain-containing protein n=1 Tax=Caenorhabditis brenneri TaxID=135651 RepID=G0N5Z0_CAEBE|nr:hypothetical protein CAEBREN_01566 [Caenorhabditis brenneri]
MVGWSHLPPEIKQHVVKKLDFMSRHSLKSTSYTDRQIVNSTPLKIPRVRFGHKDGRCLIVIYTGVEQFLRWELFDEGDGVTLQRSENCYDTAEFKRMTIQKANSLQMGINIMSNLLAHESIKIDVFEWDIPCENEEEAEERMLKIIEYSNGKKFRVSEILSNSNPGCGIISTYSYFICCEVRELKTLYVASSDINIFPHKTVEFKTVTDEVSYGVICILYEELDEIDELPEDAFEEIGKHEDVKFSCAIEREVTAERTPAQQPTRSEENGFIKLTYTTECGKYITKMFPNDEQFIKNQLVVSFSS